MKTIIAFAGPSGAGKSELVRGLIESYPDNVTKWQQFTTRPRRGPGDDYVFLSRDGYKKVQESLTCRTQFNGNFYGTMPEVTPKDVAVLTIADIEGIQDLYRDVREHNEAVGGPARSGKFGDEPVELICVLVRYDVTEAQVARRGREARGVNFASNELAQLEHAFAGRWDVTLDTTANWVDPTDFFAEHVWPRISGPDPMEDFERTVSEFSKVIRENPSAAADATRAMRDLMDDITSGTASDEQPPEEEAAPSGDIGETLEAVVERKHRPLGSHASETPQAEEYDEASAIVGDEPTEQEPSPEGVAADELADAAQEPAAAETPVAPVAPVDGAPQGEKQPAEGPAAAPQESPSKLSVIRGLMAENPFPAWLSESGTGLTATASREAFERSFAAYMVSIGVSVNDLRTEYGEDKDGRGGVVAVFTVSQDSTGFSETLRFNKRLRQFI